MASDERRPGEDGSFMGRLTVLDEPLCLGWADGLARKHDADRTP
jgi:hypothetical protein